MQLGFHQVRRRRSDGSNRRGWEKLENSQKRIVDKNVSSPGSPGTSLLDKSFSRSTSEPLPGTHGAEAEEHLNQPSIPPEPLPGTHPEQPKPLLHKAVPGEPGVSDEISKNSQTDNLVDQSAGEAIRDREQSRQHEQRETLMGKNRR